MLTAIAPPTFLMSIPIIVKRAVSPRKRIISTPRKVSTFETASSGAVPKPQRIVPVTAEQAMNESSITVFAISITSNLLR